MKKLLIILALATGVSSLAIAHSGGTDEQGCHQNKKTGGWHCH